MIYSLDDLKQRFVRCRMDGTDQERFLHNLKVVLEQFVPGPIEVAAKFSRSYYRERGISATVRFFRFPSHTDEMMAKIQAICALPALDFSIDHHNYTPNYVFTSPQDNELVDFPIALDGAVFQARKLDVMSLMGAIDNMALQSKTPPGFMMAEWSKKQLEEQVLGWKDRAPSKM